MTRKPYVAGTFYPGDATALRETIDEMTDPRAERRPALAVVAPHAGYTYSGPVAGAVYSSVEIPGTAVILGPGHREIGTLLAIQDSGSWQTPLGETPVNAELAALVKQNCAAVETDERAHRFEHSLEVQVPFLQYFRPDIRIVPVCVSYEAEYDDLEALGRGAAAAIRAFGAPVLVVASTDMSHYVSQKTAETRDHRAIRKILDLDPEGLFRTVRAEGITMCGYQPTAAALVAARELGAERAELVKYLTSGDRTGDYAQVVGYAGIRVI